MPKNAIFQVGGHPSVGTSSFRRSYDGGGMHLRYVYSPLLVACLRLVTEHICNQRIQLKRVNKQTPPIVYYRRCYAI